MHVESCLPVEAFGQALERRNFYNFFLTNIIRQGSVRKLRIRADIMDPSNIGYSAPKIRKHGGSIQIIVRRMPSFKHNFLDIEIPLDADVTSATFGHKNAEIWPRDEIKEPTSEIEDQSIKIAMGQYRNNFPDVPMDSCVISVLRKHPAQKKGLVVVQITQIFEVWNKEKSVSAIYIVDPRTGEITVRQLN